MKKIIYPILILIATSCFVIKKQQDADLNIRNNNAKVQPEIESTSQAGPAKQKYIVKTIQKDSFQNASSFINTNSKSSETALKSGGITGSKLVNTGNQISNIDFIFGWSTDNGEVTVKEEESYVELISTGQNCRFIKLIDVQSEMQSLHFNYSSDNQAELLITYLNEENNLNQVTVLKANHDFTEKEVNFSEKSESSNILLKIILKPQSYFKIKGES